MPYVYTKDSSYDTSRGLINAILTNDKMAEEEKSELIANVMNEFKVEYPELKYHATKQDVTETELRLTKEIENTRKEIKELDLKLTQEIENTRKEIKELDLKLTQEIENTRKEIKELDVKLTKEIEQSKEFRADVNRRFDETLKRLDRFMFWSLGLVMASTALIIKILG